jgi:hypothetical protein
VSSYTTADRLQWDEFVRTAKNGHFMFLRDYMEYHADRFPDSSLMFHDAQAEKAGLKVEPSTDFDTFMTIQEEILWTRHNAKPTHTARELALLAGRFPDNIRLFVVRRDAEMLGGVVIYETARVAHTQYIGASEEGRRLGALDLIFQHLIHERYADKDHFDFGISSSDNGRHLNAGLIRNKETYGARVTVFDWYAINPTAALNRLSGRP